MQGKLSTHVLDTYHGRPAAGVSWTLSFLQSEEGWVSLATGVTNADGRTDEPLLVGERLFTGAYRLVFDVGAYFREKKVVLLEPAFLEKVVLEVNLQAGQAYHVPLLMSPWSYSTYRGS